MRGRIWPLCFPLSSNPGELQVTHEILVICRTVDPATAQAVGIAGARAIEQIERGYGGALTMGFQMAQGQYFLTMDADLSHNPEFVRDLWSQRGDADVLIASRYVKGGRPSCRGAVTC